MTFWCWFHCIAQMLLIWLLIPAASAMMDCRSACEMCQTGSDTLARLSNCALCKECILTMKRRMMELHLPNKQNVLVEGQVQFPSEGKMVLQGKVVNNQQMKELKELEKREFAQMMKEYGWQPADFLDDTIVDDRDDECLTPKECLRDSDEKPKDVSIEKLINVQTPHTKCPTLPQVVCPTVPQIVCPPYCVPTTVAQRTTASTSCPPIIPCEERQKLIGIVRTLSTMPFNYKTRKMVLRDLVRLDTAEEEAMDCPPQPICPEDEEDPEYEKDRLRKYSTIPPHTRRTSTRFMPISSSKEYTHKTPRSKEQTCMPCVPTCPLPCQPFPIPYPLPPTIPPEALQALMTLTTATPKEKKKLAYNTLDPVKHINEESEEEQGKSTKTTKDYVYMYVGIPKETKIERG